MTPAVFAAVLFAALLHAGWNALVKGGLDKKTALGAVVLGHVPIALIAVTLMPFPAPAAWPWLGLGLLFHLGYQAFLTRAYETGDLTQVYPIARGSAPLIVTVVSVSVLGAELSPLQLTGIAVIIGGLFSLAFVRQGDGQRNLAAARTALITGLFIAGYSLADGIGARHAGTAVGYYSWLALANGVIWLAYMARFAPASLALIPTQGKWVFWIGGTASWAAYALVVWGFTQAPLATVTALRETSVIFALILGMLFLGERLTAFKIFATFCAVAGAILLRLGS